MYVIHVHERTVKPSTVVGNINCAKIKKYPVISQQLTQDIPFYQ